MLLFIVKRVLLMIPTLAVISVISYIIIELPPEITFQPTSTS